nr:MAG TPA: tail tube protein [Caudoviricetes sp.]
MARGVNVPIALNDMEVYINGVNSLSGIAEVELPNIENSTVTSEQIGMSSEFEVPLIGHFKKLETKIKMDCVDDTMLTFNNGSALDVECKGSIQLIDKITHAAKFRGVDVSLRGLIKKMDGFKVKPGAKLEGSIEMSVSYYKLEINGKTITEIDVLNNISNTNGHTNDTIRRQLGLI